LEENKRSIDSFSTIFDQPGTPNPPDAPSKRFDYGTGTSQSAEEAQGLLASLEAISRPLACS
jgi:hypothetical protein